MNSRDPLTVTERSALKAITESWIGALMSRDAGDPDVLRSALAKVYRHHGCEPPPRIVLAPSPLAASIAFKIAGRAWWIGDHPQCLAEEFLDNYLDERVRSQLVPIDLSIDVAACDFPSGSFDPTVHFRDDCRITIARSNWRATQVTAIRAPVRAHYDAEIRAVKVDRVFPSAQYMRFGADTFDAALAAVRRAIGEIGDELPFARQWPIFQTLKGATGIPDTTGKSFEEVVAAFKAVECEIKPWRTTILGRVPTFRKADYHEWARPKKLEAALGRRLGHLTHELLSYSAVHSSPPFDSEYFTHLPMLQLACEARGLELHEVTRAAMDIARHAGVHWRHRRFCIISERPLELHVDNLGRAHSAAGPSHRWRDGLALYHWHGVRIPASLIEGRQSLTAREVLSYDNQEQRRAAVELYCEMRGTEALLDDLGARVLARDETHGLPRELLEVAGVRYIRVVNGTAESDGARKSFLLSAAEEAATPAAAVAASYDLPASVYREAVRT